MKLKYIFPFLFLCCFVACEDEEKPEIIQAIEDAAADHVRPESAADKLVQEQLEAYNKRDLDEFLKPFSDSVKVYNNLRDFNYQGIDKMRENYANWFDGLDTLNCQIVNRISAGNTVIDYERLTFKRKNGEGNTSETIAIYRIGDDKIQEVTFVRPVWKY